MVWLHYLSLKLNTHVAALGIADALTREIQSLKHIEKRYAAREDHPTWKTYATMHPASYIRTYIVHINLFYLQYIRCLSFSSFKRVVYGWSQEKDAPVAIATTVAPRRTLIPRGSLDRMIYISIATSMYSNMLDAEGTIILPKASLYAIRHGIDPSRSQSSSNPLLLLVSTIIQSCILFFVFIRTTTQF